MGIEVKGDTVEQSAVGTFAFASVSPGCDPGVATGEQ